MSKEFKDVVEHHGYANAVLYFQEHWCDNCPHANSCLYIENCYFFTKWFDDITLMKELLKEERNRRTLFDCWE